MADARDPGFDLTTEPRSGNVKPITMEDITSPITSRLDKFINPCRDSEVGLLKARIAELERMDTEHTLQIAKMNGYISYLEEERRYRKCSEGLPSAKQRVLFLAKYKTDKVREWIGEFCHVDGMKEDFAVFYASAPGWGCEFLIDEVIGWMPLPKAPEEE